MYSHALACSSVLPRNGALTACRIGPDPKSPLTSAYVRSSVRDMDARPQPRVRISSQTSTLGRFAALLAMVVAAMTLSLAPMASAGHYHTYNNIEHGLVHGCCTQDGSFFSRTYGYYVSTYNYCAVGHVSAGTHTGWTYANAYSIGGELCSLWSMHYGNFWDECAGFSYSEVATFSGGSYLSGHYHYAHNASPYTCPVQSV
jgi:hypothetical protein